MRETYQEQKIPRSDLMALQHAVPDAAADPTANAASGVASDASLVREVIQGSQQAFAALYDRHANAVYAACMRVSRDSWIAAEVVQETFLALWNQAERFDPSRGPLTAWLQRIARNRTIDHLRSAGRHHRAGPFSSFSTVTASGPSIDDWLTGSGELIAMAQAEAGPEAALSSKETRASIADALATLAPQERSVIQLAYADGLSQSEIATRLGWPIGTVKTRTRRALHRLRDLLDAPRGPAATASSLAPCVQPCPA
jgi:RNA polymerase sigma-70 factor, ECF subfamily